MSRLGSAVILWMGVSLEKLSADMKTQLQIMTDFVLNTSL